MPGLYVVSMIDYSKEVSTVSINTPVVTDVNYATVDGQEDTLLAAMEAVSLMSTFKEQRVAEIIKSVPTPPADTSAQREQKWLVSGYDSVNLNPWTVTIPGADDSLLDPNNTDRMNPDAAQYTALVNAIEALALSAAGNSVVVDEIILVGRNL